MLSQIRRWFKELTNIDHPPAAQIVWLGDRFWQYVLFVDSVMDRLVTWCLDWRIELNILLYRSPAKIITCLEFCKTLWQRLRKKYFIFWPDIIISAWTVDLLQIDGHDHLINSGFYIRTATMWVRLSIAHYKAKALDRLDDYLDLLANKVLVFGVYRAHYVKKYLYTINHKRIALNYLYFTFVSGLAGALLATFIRIELSQPGSHFFKGDSVRYIQVITSHGLVMIFYVVIPIVFGTFANFFIPYHVGSKDVAYPRLNSIGFWILPGGFLLFSKPAFVRRQTYKSWDPYDGYFSTKYDVWAQVEGLVDSFVRYGSSIWGDKIWDVLSQFYNDGDERVMTGLHSTGRLVPRGRMNAKVYGGDRFLNDLNSIRTITEDHCFFTGGVYPWPGGRGSGFSRTLSHRRLLGFYYPFDTIFDSAEEQRASNLSVIPRRLRMTSLKEILRAMNAGIGPKAMKSFNSWEKHSIQSSDVELPNGHQPSSVLEGYKTFLIGEGLSQLISSEAVILNRSGVVKLLNLFQPTDFRLSRNLHNVIYGRLPQRAKSLHQLYDFLKDYWVSESLWWRKIDLAVLSWNNIEWFRVNNFELHHSFVHSQRHWVMREPKSNILWGPYESYFFPRPNAYGEQAIFEQQIESVAKYILVKGVETLQSPLASWADVQRTKESLPSRNYGRKDGPFSSLKGWSDLLVQWELGQVWANNPWSTLKNTTAPKSIIIKNHKCNSPAYVMSGWTFITPFSSQTRFTGVGSQDVATVTVVFAGVSSTLSFTNLLLTRRVLGTIGVRNRKNTLPFLSITLLLVMRMLAAITPVLGGAMVMLMFDRHLLTSFFDYAYGGDIVLFHHLFWFFGHPEVYVVMIPVFGIVNMILPYYNTRRIASKNHLVWATYVMAYMGFLVWGHHMYLVGLDHRSRSLYSTITVMISLPAVVKIVNWTLTLLNGSLCVDIPFVFIMSFLGFFLCGGLTGLWLSHVGLNLFVHDTFYVVAHFHFMFSCATFSGIFSAIYFYFNSFFNNAYARLLASFHYVCWTSGQWITFIPLYWVGYNGLPRRYHDYPKMYSGWHGLATVGHLVTMLGIICFFYTVGESKIMKLVSPAQSFSHPRLFKSATYLLAKQEWLEARSRNRIQ